MSKIFYGEEGFWGYLMYCFNKYLIIDSIFYGNAAYICEMKHFQELKKLNKQELNARKLTLKRIIHIDNWKEKISPYTF